LPRLATDEVGDVLQVARVRILPYLARRGVVRLVGTSAIFEMPRLKVLYRVKRRHGALRLLAPIPSLGTLLTVPFGLLLLTNLYLLSTGDDAASTDGPAM
jgi:hypothetical protein